ncbi:hypothetical protein [Kitasatospora purpeofusca]|uniref:hypothetical protein n=1 Tax=Kitasatospora purpeofusca TaxID=67352 RepID=UPI003F4AE93E
MCEGSGTGDEPGDFDGGKGDEGHRPPNEPGDVVAKGGAGGVAKGSAKDGAKVGAGGDGGDSDVYMEPGVGFTFQGKGGHAGADGSDGRVEITW